MIADKIKALVFERNELRYATSKAAGWFSQDAACEFGPLRLAHIDPPELPSQPGWQRLRPRLSGICGSDLSTISCETSRYFELLVSFPFVMGHEIVGDLEDGRRVVIDAVLGCAARGFPPPHAGAAPADGHDYSHSATGHLEPGIQTGNCASTGGGWASELVVHESQIHEVPQSFSDEAAVMIEPCASSIHAVLRGLAGIDAEVIAVLGSGTIGLCALAAARKYAPEATIVATAKHPTQKELAEQLGADVVVSPDEVRRAVRRISGSAMHGDFLAGGSDICIDAVASASSLADALAITRPRGRIVLSGMPAAVKLDLAPLWHREVELTGAYTYGTETLADESQTHTFQLALDLIADQKLERLVTDSYRLDDYRDAIRQAMNAGRLGSVKVVFDLRD